VLCARILKQTAKPSPWQILALALALALQLVGRTKLGGKLERQNNELVRHLKKGPSEKPEKLSSWP